VRIWLAVVAILGLAVAMAWASDAITLQGERTVYTVDCVQGQWQGAICSGVLAAGKRYRFRALRAHNEVMFWTVGASDEPSGKFSGCRVVDGRNWICPPSGDAALTITLQMERGAPVPGVSGKTRPYHAVTKWRWWLLRWGIPTGSSADN